MHIYEGILSATPAGQELLIGGAVTAALGTAIGLYKLDYDRIPKTAVLSAAFFVASLIQVPLGPTSVHLVLGGLMGLVLGWSAFPAVLVALVLQTVFFTPTGPTAIGLNTLIMALPAVMCYYLFRAAAGSSREPIVFLAGFAAGMTAILLGGLLSSGALLFSGNHFETAASLLMAAYVPVAVVEGLITGSVVVLLRKVRPEVLESLPLAPQAQEVLHV